MNDSADRNSDHPVHIVLFGYGQAGTAKVSGLLTGNEIGRAATVTSCELASHRECEADMAIAVFSAGNDLQRFLSDLASLHVVRQIPRVIAVVDEGARETVTGSESELSADSTVYLPADPAEFTRTVMTHVVALKLRRPGARGNGATRLRSLGEILVEHGIITPMQLKKALDYQGTTGQRLGDALVELGFIEEEQKLHFLASQRRVAIASPKQYASAEISVVALIPERIARRYHCIALEREGDELRVAMTDVLDLRLLDSLRDITECRIVPVLGRREDIDASVERYYRDIASHREASDLAPEFGDDVEVLQDKDEETNIEAIAAAGAEVGIIKLVNMLIANAVKDRASDIHVEPMERELVVRYRIDGDLRKIIAPPRRTHQAIITRIKILSNLDIAERRLPQDGRMVLKMGSREVDIRVSVLPTVYGEKAVLRILDREAFERSTANLGFSAQDLAVFKAQIAKPYGMIIVTGPTGSGKSTTLYSAVQAIRTVTRNIVTVEDPVEFHMDGVAQVHVNTKIGLTFGSALRSILRQDPDIVLIGEIRDAETADIAIKMSLTGHLVFSTLHTNDAASAIARFVDIGVPPLLLASSLNLVVAQRLVRKVCAKCKVQVEPPPELVEQLRLPKGERPTFYRGEGCVSCNGSGYSGRTGIFEMLAASRDVRTLILRNAPTHEIQELAEREGMKTLRQAGIALCLQGITTVEQVIAVTTER